jgi:hypothetical protein
MRKMLFAASAVAALGLVGVSGAGAVPADATAVKEAAAAAGASPLQQAEYVERHTRHGIVKCYRDLVIGPYRCHHYRDPL